MSATDLSIRKAALASDLHRVREKTFSLLDNVSDQFFRKRVHSFYSPIGWHFGHVGRTEEFWVCEATGKSPVDSALTFLFADLPDNPKDNRVNIPDRAGTIDYLNRTRDVVLEELERADFDSDNPLIHGGYAWSFALQHECQHQETIAEMLQLIRKQEGPKQIEPHRWSTNLIDEFLQLPGGEFTMGDSDPNGYDNEMDPHEVSVGPFKLSRYPVTAFQWSQFMEDGGYDRPEFWSTEGWAWKEENHAQMPEYWHRQPDGFGYFGAFGMRPIHPDEAASSLSHHEAIAYAKWKGKRLPTEAEWEYAASAVGESAEKRRFAWGSQEPNSDLANFEMNLGQVCQVNQHGPGRSPQGIEGLSGNIWEWTSSTFAPYPGFRAFPYDGYSLDHMKGKHFVCRGGSWATNAIILRNTFRNWYVPTYRQGFLGLRLADD